jgi:NAD(P)-dependent dehydrogenase (short-subunit alcohol dehydrogenase family)
LARGLYPALAEAAGARIVSVSSVGHVAAGIDFDDLLFDRRPYDPWIAYGQSKTANILFAVEAARRWADDGISANALNPGRIPSTNLMRHMATAGAAAPGSPAASSAASTSAPTTASDSNGVSLKNAQQGAATSVLLAGSPLLAGVSGRYFEDCQEAEPHRPGVRRGVQPYAIDPLIAQHLWKASEDLILRAF